MFKRSLPTFSKIMSGAALITLIISSGVKASELAFNIDPITCEQTHRTLRVIGTSLNVTELAAVQAIERDTHSNALPHRRVLGCQVCSNFLTDLPNLQISTTQGEHLLQRAIQTYTMQNPGISLNGLTWGNINS